VTINGNNNNLIKDWIRPLQKSLTIETENKFINTLGIKKYFNDYLHESLKKIDNLNLSEEYLRIFYEFSKKYSEYNKLNESDKRKSNFSSLKIKNSITKPNLKVSNRGPDTNKDFPNKKNFDDWIWGKHSVFEALSSERAINRIWCTSEIFSSEKFYILLKNLKSKGSS